MKTYATVAEWAAAMTRAIEMGSQLIGDLPQREQLHEMRQALAKIVELDNARLPAPPLATAETISACRSCHAPVVWRKTPTDRFAPFDVVNGTCNGINHFTTCPDAAKWSKKRAPR